MNKFLECRNNHAQKDCRHKQHYSVLKTTSLSCEGGLAPILQRDFDLVVPREPISEGICFLDAYIVQHFIREQIREGIMQKKCHSVL